MNKTTKIILGAVILVIVILIVVFYKPTPKETIKIGIIAPLTGEAASWGQNALAGVTLAVKEINNEGGIKGQQIELIIEDDQCNPEKGVNAINKLVNIDKVIGVFPVCAASIGAILPITQKNQIPTIIILGGTASFTKMGDYIFRVYPSDDSQAKFGAEFILNTLNKKKVAVIYVNNESGEGIREAFKNYFKNLGGEIVHESSALQTETDFRTEITKVKDSEAKALYFPVYPANAIAGLKQIQEIGLDVPVIGYAPFGGKEVVESGYANGVMFTAPKISSSQDFEGKIHILSGFEKLQILFSAQLGYDATKIMFSVIEKGGINRNVIKEELTKTSYKGISNPLIEFDGNRDVKNPVFEVKIIKDKKVLPYEK